MIEFIIDFGNSYTTISRKDYGIVLKEPTLLAVKENEDGYYKISAFGSEVNNYLNKPGEKITIFSPVFNGEIKSDDYAFEFLNYFIKKLLKNEKAYKKFSCTFCIPLCFSSETAAHYEFLAGKLGFSEVKFLPSIVASAIGVRKELGSMPILIAELGGGRSDIAFIRNSQIIKGISILSGGRTIDQNIIKIVNENFNVNIGVITAMKAKEEIGSLLENDTAAVEIAGKNSEGKKKVVTITANDIRPAFEDYFIKLAFAIENFLNALNTEDKKIILSEGIHITGGPSVILGLSEFLSDKLKMNVIIDVNNDFALSNGVNIILNSNKKILQSICTEF